MDGVNLLEDRGGFEKRTLAIKRKASHVFGFGRERCFIRQNILFCRDNISCGSVMGRKVKVESEMT